MKRLTCVSLVLMVLTLLPLEAAFAKQSLPIVPVTYPGDTEETIARRAQWIEGAKKEGKFMWWTSYTPKEIQPLIAPFTKIYPFITVDFWRGQDVERVTKLESEQASGHLSVDIMEGGAPQSFPRWRKMGIPENFINIIPQIKKVDKRIYSKYGDWVMPEHAVITPQYNTKLVPAAEAPKKWEDLLDSKWKGQLGLTPDMKAWYMLALGEKGWGIKKTEEFLKKLKLQQPIWASGHTAGHQLMIAGEFKVFGESYTYQIPPSKAKGAPVEMVRANPALVSGSYYMLMKKAPHPNAARLFLEWFLSPQGFLTIEKVTGKGNVFPGSGTQQSKYLEGMEFIFKSEEMILKADELGLIKNFANILGVTPD